MNRLSAEKLKSFSEGLLESRLCSQQRVDVVGNAESYRLLLEENKEKIGTIRKSNTEYFDDVIKPLLKSDELLDDETVKLLDDFCDSLLVSWPEEDLDLSIHFLVSRRLYEDALNKGNDDEIVRHAGTFINSCYNNLNRVNRVKTTREFTEFFKNAGLEAADVILSYLDKEKYSRLKESESKRIFFAQCRFYNALYDTFYAIDEKENEERIDGLVRAINLSYDDFYVKDVEGFDRKKHIFRCCEHMGQLTENGNQWQMTPAQCKKIMPYMDDLKKRWEEDPDEGEKYLPKVHLDLIYARNSYYSGKMKIADYKAFLIDLYDKYANDEYDMYSVLANLFIPTEYLSLLDEKRLGREDTDTLLRMYEQISGYVLSSRGSGSFSFMMEYLNSFLERFIEIPGKFSFEEMVLNCLAALHPESYIHSVQTAHIARCIALHIIRIKPHKLAGILDCGPSNDVSGRRDDTLQTIYHLACCMDAGEISVIDTVLTCGRRLLSAEKRLLEQENDMSVYLLKKHHLFDDKFLTTESFGILYSILDISSDIVSLYEEGHAVRDIIENRLKKPNETDHPAEYAYVSSFMAGKIRLYEDMSSILSRGKDDRYLDLWYKLNDVQKGAKLSLDNMLEGYVIRTRRIRELSAPQPGSVSIASEYEKVFLRQFSEIGQIAVQNKEFLSRELYPLTSSDHDLTGNDVESLYNFCFELMNGQDLGDIDQGLTYYVSRRVLEDVHKKNDPDMLVKCLDLHISSCYEMAHQAKRMHTAGIIVEEYRSEGLRAAKEMWSFAEKDKFLTLDEESRQLVLINMRYAYYLYETAFDEEGINDLFIEGLMHAFDMADDPFYTENSGDYDWNYHRIRSLEYLGQSTECGNARGFTESQCKTIASRMRKLNEIVGSDVKKNHEILPGPCVSLLLCRNVYFAGESDIEEYRDSLRKIYAGRDSLSYDFNSVFPNLVVPLELLISFEKETFLSESVKNEIVDIYKSVIGYVTNGKNGESFSLLLEYLSEFIYHFIEVEDRFSFEQMGLFTMAAIHPPTYIHSLMVGELSVCICAHLLKKRPELFSSLTQITGKSKNDVRTKRILDYCYHSAVCHDFGKIPMIDTIFLYGRNLLDHEFNLLKHHSRTGALLLSSYESTKKYSDVAKGHHKWYNNSRGYPEEYDNTASEYRIFTDIVTVADCLDAATDTVGRSYTGSKTPDMIINEIIEGGGTRYNPDIAALLSDGDLRNEIIYILDKIRKETYKKNFGVLKEFLKDGSGSLADVSFLDESDEDLKALHGMLSEEESFRQAYRIVNYDLETVCPIEGRSEENSLLAVLSRESYRIRKKAKYVKLLLKLYPRRDEFNSYNKALLERLYDRYLREKDFSTGAHKRFDEVNIQAHRSWLEARSKNNYLFFRDALSNRIEAEKDRVSKFASEGRFPEGLYDRMLDEYEPGLTVRKMDSLFDESIPRIRKILESVPDFTKKENFDFLSREASDYQQSQMTDYLLDILGFDKNRGMCSISVHPFTERLGRADTRITTSYDRFNIFSNIYTVIHECGHALFEQMQPEANHIYHIADNKTMGQHETVSRFYENIIGRSREFIELIYPGLCEIFPDVMEGVSVDELYRGVNLTRPSLIRMDADELTYIFHIYIRYEMEKGLIDGSILPENASEKWAEYYSNVLGVTPGDDLEGILQDIHWTDSFGYFPTYALGNFYGAMILSRMKEDFDPFEAVKKGNIGAINSWMAENVFLKADRLLPFDWIKDVTGRELTADDFVTYLEQKYLKHQENQKQL